jgi:hypothetical protein
MRNVRRGALLKTATRHPESRPRLSYTLPTGVVGSSAGIVGEWMHPIDP